MLKYSVTQTITPTVIIIIFFFIFDNLLTLYKAPYLGDECWQPPFFVHQRMLPTGVPDALELVPHSWQCAFGHRLAEWWMHYLLADPLFQRSEESTLLRDDTQSLVERPSTHLLDECHRLGLGTLQQFPILLHLLQRERTVHKPFTHSPQSIDNLKVSRILRMRIQELIDPNRIPVKYSFIALLRPIQLYTIQQESHIRNCLLVAEETAFKMRPSESW